MTNTFLETLKQINDPLHLILTLTGETLENVTEDTIRSKTFTMLPDIQLNVTDSDGNTVLHHCAMSNSHLFADIYLRCGIQPNAVNSKGETAAILATKKRAFKTLTVLCSHKVDLTIQDANG